MSRLNMWSTQKFDFRTHSYARQLLDEDLPNFSDIGRPLTNFCLKLVQLSSSLKHYPHIGRYFFRYRRKLLANMKQANIACKIPVTMKSASNAGHINGVNLLVKSRRMSVIAGKSCILVVPAPGAETTIRSIEKYKCRLTYVNNARCLVLQLDYCLYDCPAQQQSSHFLLPTSKNENEQNKPFYAMRGDRTNTDDRNGALFQW